MELATPENMEIPQLADVPGRTSIKISNSSSRTVEVDSRTFGKVLITV